MKDDVQVANDLLWHLLFAAYNKRENIVKEALNAENFDDEGHHYEKMYEAHARAYAEIAEKQLKTSLDFYKRKREEPRH